MGILKKLGKALGGVAKAGMTIPGTDVNPAQMLGGSLASALGAEKKQHEQHDKVKEIHHHYGKEKKKGK
jgi:Ni,Fe-hydrogenase III small subunit